MSTLAVGMARRISMQSPTNTESTSREWIRAMGALMSHRESHVNGSVFLAVLPRAFQAEVPESVELARRAAQVAFVDDRDGLRRCKTHPRWPRTLGRLFQGRYTV